MGKKGMGWVPDYPDVRDCTLKHDRVQGVQKNKGQPLNGSEQVERISQLIEILRSQLSGKFDALTALTADVQSDIDQHLYFLSASFADGILTLESEGKEVAELQDKLRILGYDSQPTENSDQTTKEAVKRSQPGYFDQTTENAVKQFQQDQLIEPANGIVTAVTRAELLALAAIAGKFNRSKHKPTLKNFRNFNPKTICAQELLKQAMPQLQITDLPGIFSESTRQAVVKFQEENRLRADGIIGPKTGEKLELSRNKKLNFRLSPVPRRIFKELADEIYDIILAAEGRKGKIVSLLGGRTQINTALFGSDKVLLSVIWKEKIQRRIEPLTELLIQLAPCLGEDDRKTALTKAYNIVKRIPFKCGTDQPVSLPNDQEVTLTGQDLELIVEQIRDTGYISSNIFQHSDYKVEDSGPAVIYIQERLRALGYYNAPTTGYFEQLTKNAVKQFQTATMQAQELPDGIVNLVTILNLYGNKDARKETFKFLEPPISPQFTETIISQTTLVQRVYDSLKIDFSEEDAQLNKKLNDELKKLSDELKKLVLPNDSDSETQERQQVIAGLLKTAQNPRKPPFVRQEAVKQLIVLVAQLIIRPIVKVIAQIVAPIAQYSDLEQACADGLARFKVFANFDRIRKIDKAMKGIPSELPSESFNAFESLDQYEPLVEMLATMQAEFKRYGRSLENASPLNQFKPLVLMALKSVTQFNVMRSPTEDLDHTSIVAKIKECLLQELYVHPEYGDDDSEQFQAFLKTQVFDQKPVRTPTFIHVQHECNKCLLQVPMLGKLCKELSVSQASALATTPQAGSSLYLALPPAVDLSLWCTPVEDQGKLDACTAHAGVALVEYFEKRSSGNPIDASRRFLYKVTRSLMHRRGDTGASVRETMKAMVLFGVPPEEYCPYDETRYDEDPTAFCYAFAQNYQAITYFRLDAAGIATKELLAQIKTVLVAGFPCMFGFTVYDSIYDEANPPGHIPYPRGNEKREGGHAAIVVGYDDYKRVKNAPNAGALLIKNSWGKNWGASGYGWLPYDYVLVGLARDWWSLIKAEWVETEQFGLGSDSSWTSTLGNNDNRDD